MRAANAPEPVIMPFRDERRWYSRAFKVAAHRSIIALEKGRVQAKAAPHIEHRFDRDIVGCLGESAVAAYLELDWEPQDVCDYAGDVGNVHVRATPYVTGALVINPTDPPDGRFVLVTLDYGRVRANLVGWCHAREGQKLPILQKNPSRGEAGATHWVEQNSGILKPMNDLKTELAQETLTAEAA
jgi:hypothetical protein